MFDRESCCTVVVVVVVVFASVVGDLDLVICSLEVEIYVRII